MISLGIPTTTDLNMQLPEVRVQGVYNQNPTYIFTQGVAAQDWYITHNLNKFPSITVIDSANNVVYGGAEYISNNEVALHFSAPFAGTAYLN